MIPRLTLERYDKQVRGERAADYLQEAIEDGAVFEQRRDGTWDVVNIVDPVAWAWPSKDKNTAARGYCNSRDNLTERILYRDRLQARQQSWWRRLFAA